MIASQDNSIGPIERDRIRTYYNCIDTKKFRRIDEEESLAKYRSKYDIKAKDYVVVYTGRLSPEKGVDILLEATRLLEDKSIVLLIVGSFAYGSNFKDAYHTCLEELAKDQSGKVVFTGYVPNDELVYIYNTADVAVLPSVWDEPAGLTMIEAMACGTPVITTDSGGIPEYVGDCAVIVKNDENLSKSIAREILNLKNSKDREEIASRGIQWVRDNFSNEGYLDRLLSLLE